MRKALRRASIAICLVLLVGIIPAIAQVSTGEILGKVADASGAVLPGVTVTLSSPSLITPRVVTTSETGAFRFPSTPIGTYTVKFELAGFKSYVRSDIIIQAGF